MMPKMQNNQSGSGHLLATLLLLCFTLFALPFTAAAAAPPLSLITSGCTTAFYIDADCDGYGVAAPKGPDADDGDASVNTAATALARYGSLEKLLQHLGYAPKKIIFLAADVPADGGEGTEQAPFGSWNQVKTILTPGDMVVYKGGVYGKNEANSRFRINATNIHGSAEEPIILLAYPGQKVVIYGEYNAVEISKSTHIIVDGFVCDAASGSGRAGLEMHFPENVTLKNIETSHHTWGVFGSQGWRNILMENLVTHDNPQEHGIYIGSREQPNTNITLRHSLSYKNGRHGLQHNGRCEGLILDGNILHSNFLGGISLINGVTNSTFRNNLIFNNNKQGIILYIYDESKANILPFNHTDNLFENNIVWVGRDNNGLGDQAPADYPAVLFNDKTGKFTMSGNTFRHNVFCTCNGPIFEFDQLSHLPVTSIHNNLFFRTPIKKWTDVLKTSKVGMVMASKETDGTHKTSQGILYQWSLELMQSKSELIRDNIMQDPLFTDAVPEYSRSPEKFIFSFLPESPALSKGIIKKPETLIPLPAPVMKTAPADLRPPKVTGLRIIKEELQADAPPGN